MKALEYFRASRLQKDTGNEHKKNVLAWKKRHAKMVEEMATGEFAPITLTVDEMTAENLIFYHMNGSKMLNKDTLFSIETTTIDTGDDFTQHIKPTYFLVRDSKKKLPISVDNTTMYRVTYHKQKDSPNYSYTIDTLIDNEDSSSSKFFPEVFCGVTVSHNVTSYESKPHYEYQYSPLPKLRDPRRFERRDAFSKIENSYESRILKKIKAFGLRPSSNFNAEKEM